MIYYVGIGDWGLGIGPNPQSPIPNPLITYFNTIINALISIFIIQNKIITNKS